MTKEEVRMSVLASPAAVGVVRDSFQRSLDKWGVSADISGDVLLSASELLTNAIRAAPRQEIWARLSRDAQGVLLEIWDPSDTMPQPRPVIELTLETLDLTPEHLDDNGGRGLSIVAALAADCGCTPHPTRGGKTLWARFKT